jgi:hypothetical protein
VTNLAGKLKAAGEAFEESPSTLQQDGRLYLTEQEWGVRRIKREVENPGSGGSGGFGGSGDKGGRGGGRGDRGRGHG